MKHTSLILSTGFALFSMFFGSGNLVFPLIVGKESGDHFALASLGICLTGVLMPFLGIWAMILCKGSTKVFFGSMGRYAPFLLTLGSLLLLGPCGVVPRCITVAYGSFHLLFPSSSSILFSFAACLLIYGVALKKDKIIGLLGVLLTPILLIALTTITICGLWFGSSPLPAASSLESFQLGFLKGYHTMDLLAAFFFAAFVIKQLEKQAETNPGQSPLKIFFQSASVGAGLLAAIYFVLVWLGAAYAEQLQNIPPQEMLGVVAQHALGIYAAPIVCVAVTLACFTTAVVLATLFADFLRQQVAREKISQKLSLAITLIITFLISTLEFSGIAQFLAPILETIYPALIMLTLLNIGMVMMGMKKRRWPVLLVVLAKIGWV